VSSRIELNNDSVTTDSAGPKFSATPRAFVRERTENDAIRRSAIHVHFFALSEIEVAEMYAYAGRAGGLDD
jgi:hypothetical protein